MKAKSKYERVKQVCEEAGVPVTPPTGSDLAFLQRAAGGFAPVDLSVVGWKSEPVVGNAGYTFEDPDHPYITSWFGQGMSDEGTSAILAHELGHFIAYRMGKQDPLGAPWSEHDLVNGFADVDDPRNLYESERNASWWGYVILLETFGEVTDEQRAFLNFSIYQRAGMVPPRFVRDMDGTHDYRKDLL